MTYTAIETKVLLRTEHRPTRIKAVEMDIMPSASRPLALTMSYDDDLNTFENHKKVAKELHLQNCPYLKAWNGIKEICNHDLVFGSSNRGYVMVTYKAYN